MLPTDFQVFLQFHAQSDLLCIILQEGSACKAGLQDEQKTPETIVDDEDCCLIGQLDVFYRLLRTRERADPAPLSMLLIAFAHPGFWQY